MSWEPVENANSYVVEIDCFNCCDSERWCFDMGRPLKGVYEILRGEKTKFIFNDVKKGRWRVRAIDVDGHGGERSSWSVFEIAD